jgi:serine/threonine protein kinase
MEEALIVTIARDVLRGLEYLHRHELAHRDLKVLLS